MAYLKITGTDDLIEIEPHEAIRLTSILERASEDELIHVGNLTVKKRTIQFIQRDPKRKEQTDWNAKIEAWNKERRAFIEKPSAAKATASLKVFQMFYYAATGREAMEADLIAAYKINFAFYEANPKRAKVDPALWKSLATLVPDRRQQGHLGVPPVRQWILRFIETLVIEDMHQAQFT